MSNAKKYIGIDLGAESGRCIVASLKKEKLELIEVHRFSTHNSITEEGFFWNVAEIFNDILAGMQKACKEFGPDFESIGVDTWGVDYALLDNEYKLVGNPFHYRDSRTDGVMEDVFSVISSEKLYDLTGTQQQQINTIFQLYADSDRLKKACKILLTPDYINFLLTGKTFSEYTITSTSGLTDPRSRNWNWDLIKKLNYPQSIFPKMIEPGTVLGQIQPYIAEKTGINSKTKVIAITGHDTASAVAAVPASGDNWAFLSSGTWSLLGMERKEPVISEASRKNNCTNEGGVNKTTRLLKNIIGLWPLQECRRYWMEKGENFTYEELQTKAESFGHTVKRINLDDLRFLKAGDMPRKIIAYLKETNQRPPSSIDETVRIILESLASKYKDTIDELEEISNSKIEKIYAVGGGIQNELLCQLTADALEREVIAGPIEAAAIGNTGMQAIALRHIKDVSQLREIVANSYTLKRYIPKQSYSFA